MKQRYMTIDVALCHDCNNCFMACKDEHVDNDWPGYTAPQPRHGHRWINIERRERGQYARNDVVYLPTPCQQCGEAHCVKAANGAIAYRPDGIVMIDPVKAKGKKELVASCPFGAIYWNEEANIAQKCTMCAHLLDSKEWKPGMPRCVHSCPTGAQQFYTMEPAEFAKVVKAEGLTGFRTAELKNNPHVWYKNLHKYTKNFITAGVLVKGDCFEGATVKVTGPAGYAATQTTNFFGEFKFDGLEDGEYAVEVEAAGKKKACKVAIKGESKNLGFIEV